MPGERGGPEDEPSDHSHRARPAGDRHLLAGGARRRHRLPVRPGAARSGDHAAGERGDRGVDPPRFREPQGGGGSRRWLPRPRGQDERIPHRPGSVGQGERGHGELLQQAVPGTRGGRRRTAAAWRAGRKRVRPAPGLSRRYPAAAAGPSPAERAEQRPVSALRGVGAALAARLARLGVTRVCDLLFVLPSRYEDRTRGSAVASLSPGVRAAAEMGEWVRGLDAAALRDWLPREAVLPPGLPSLREALHYLHRPPREAQLAELAAGRHPAQRRLAFEELLAHHLTLRLRKRALKTDPAWALADGAGLARRLLAALPFALTRAQARALAAAHEDLATSVPMVRLLHGDVACGKTLVAAA